MGWLPTLLGQLRLQEDRKGHESLWGGEKGWRWQEFTWWEEGNKGQDLFLTPEGEREVLVPHSEQPASLSLWITARNQWDHFSLTTKTERHKSLLVSHLCPQN